MIIMTCTWVCYLIYTIDGNQTYVGSSNNFLKRLNNHNTGRGAKRTKGQMWIPCVVVTGFHHKNACLSFESNWKRLTHRRSNVRLELINIMTKMNLKYTTVSRWNRVLDLLYFLHNVTLLDTKYKLNHSVDHIVNEPEGLKIVMFAEDFMVDFPWPHFVTIKNHKLSEII